MMLLFKIVALQGRISNKLFNSIESTLVGFDNETRQLIKVKYMSMYGRVSELLLAASGRDTIKRSLLIIVFLIFYLALGGGCQVGVVGRIS